MVFLDFQPFPHVFLHLLPPGRFGPKFFSFWSFFFLRLSSLPLGPSTHTQEIVIIFVVPFAPTLRQPGMDPSLCLLS